MDANLRGHLRWYQYCGLVRRSWPLRRERRHRRDVFEAINDGRATIHEEGFSEVIDAHTGPDGTGQLQATTDYDAVLDTDVTFLYLPTPWNDDGRIELSITGADELQLDTTPSDAPDWYTVVVKSTAVRSTEDAIALRNGWTSWRPTRILRRTTRKRTKRSSTANRTAHVDSKIERDDQRHPSTVVAASTYARTYS